ncbi:CamS family sex pheromone protein [Salinicoccus siamensis]|uniref:CamS family sex pheromone protein n=1 Tax=Salinicoccus siamensis TaxID=381830 RepID=A0ABV5Z4H3_9STAP
MMKKNLFAIFALSLILTACGSEEEVSENEKERKSEEVNTAPVEKQEETVTEGASDTVHYRTVIPYEISPTRGLTSANMPSSYDIETFEKGLFELSKDVFPTKEYAFREGQIFTEEMVKGYLGRRYTQDEIAAMSEEEKSQNNAFSNLGLNPSAEGETDPEAIAQNAPIYLSHILEQNYMSGEGDELALNGMTIGLAMNSEYHYQKEEHGQVFTEELDKATVQQQGEKMAAEILERIRANEDYKDLEIVFAIFIQSKEDSITPGNFVSTGTAAPGEDKIGGFKEVDEKYMLLPSGEAGAISEEVNSDYKNFNRKLESYFDSFTTSIGEGYFKDGKVEHISIEIPLDYSSRGEVIGLTQYVSTLAEEHFRDIEVEISIKDKNKAYALITKNAENTVEVHIYE